MTLYHQLKEALTVQLKYRKRLPYVVAYKHELNYLNTRSSVEVNILGSDSIMQKVAQCTKCSFTEKLQIPGGTGKNGIMIVLNPPSMLSPIEKKVLQNDVDVMIQKMMAAIGVNIGDCYITYLIKCEHDKDLPGSMFSHCQHIFIDELAQYRPHIVIVMGDMRPLQRVAKENSSIQWYRIEHPITLIKNPELKRAAWNTLKLVKEKIRELS